MIRLTIDERFDTFNAANPDVLTEIINLSRAAKARGYTRYSIKGIWEVLRYRANPSTNEKYALSNDFTSRYARLVMTVAPDLAGFFTLREIKYEPPLEPEDDDPGNAEYREMLNQGAHQ